MKLERRHGLLLLGVAACYAAALVMPTRVLSSRSFQGEAVLAVGITRDR